MLCVWLTVSCFVCNVSGLSVVCCVTYCVLDCVSAVHMLSLSVVLGTGYMLGVLCV